MEGRSLYRQERLPRRHLGLASLSFALLSRKDSNLRTLFISMFSVSALFRKRETCSPGVLARESDPTCVVLNEGFFPSE